MYCVNCGTYLEADYRFCIKCGQPVVHNKNCFCTNCGALVDGKNFCTVCGTPVIQNTGSLAADTIDLTKPVDILPGSQGVFIKIYQYDEKLCIVQDQVDPIPYIRNKIIEGKRQLVFEFEPDNPTDKRAIKIKLDDQPIGYVYRGQTQDMIHDYYRKEFEIVGYINTIRQDEITYRIGFYKPKSKCRNNIVPVKSKKFTENVTAGEILDVYYDPIDERYKTLLYGEEVTLPNSVGKYGREDYEVPAEVGENCNSLIFYK